METNEYLSYLDGIDYAIQKFETIVVDEIIKKFHEANDNSYSAKQEDHMNGLTGFYRYLGEQRAYEDTLLLFKELTKELKKQHKNGYMLDHPMKIINK